MIWPTTSIVRMQFLSEWERNEDKPPVFEKAYEVILPRDIRVRHDAYWLVFHVHERVLHVCTDLSPGPKTRDQKRSGPSTVPFASVTLVSKTTTFVTGGPVEFVVLWNHPSNPLPLGGRSWKEGKSCGWWMTNTSLLSELAQIWKRNLFVSEPCLRG